MGLGNWDREVPRLFKGRVPPSPRSPVSEAVRGRWIDRTGLGRRTDDATAAAESASEKRAKEAKREKPICIIIRGGGDAISNDATTAFNEGIGERGGM